MKFYSTNGSAAVASLQEAIFKGLPEDNGLYMPLEVPRLPEDFYRELPSLTLPEIAFTVADALLQGEIPPLVLRQIAEDAFSFDAPLVAVSDRIYSLELFHGPTLAFKDFGARFMSRVMGYFTQQGKEVHILVATSGDTGSAVAQGFLNVPGTKVTILYPKGKVSHLQEQQLTTNGNNIEALEIEGTFDDCQRMVKEAFLDKALSGQLHLSSANSINISRLIPQSFYYFYAWGQLQRQKPGAEVAFVVPSGNFGNLSAGIIAWRMGLPVKHFVAATNANDVVPVYLKEGVFTPRPSVQTISNAMDVGNPSNFPRMLALLGHEHSYIQEMITGMSFDDAQTRESIREVHQQHGYLMCPHTAIGYEAAKRYLETHPEENTNAIFLATAHPAKFIDVVAPVIGEEISLPIGLAAVLQKEKRVTILPPSYQALKEHLLAAHP